MTHTLIKFDFYGYFVSTRGTQRIQRILHRIFWR